MSVGLRLDEDVKNLSGEECEIPYRTLGGNEKLVYGGTILVTIGLDLDEDVKNLSGGNVKFHILHWVGMKS